MSDDDDGGVFGQGVDVGTAVFDLRHVDIHIEGCSFNITCCLIDFKGKCAVLVILCKHLYFKNLIFIFSNMDNFIAAVIALALKQYRDAMYHDKESYIITIKRK